MSSRWQRFLPGKARRQAWEGFGERVAALKAQTAPEGAQAKQDFYLQLLLAQTPQAVLAQIQMDKHKHGYHNREKRLFELIDFNDTFVSLALETPYEQLPELRAKVKQAMSERCRQLQTPMFSDEQFDAITRGLGREVAVYRALQQEGFGVAMTSRTTDAFGIDMVVTQPASGKKLNIDCKTPPAFRHRLEELLKHRRLTEAELLKADEAAYFTHLQRHGRESIPVTLISLRPEVVGDIHDFSFDDTKPLAAFMNRIFQTAPR
jgi:hypothetical protein